MEQWVGDICCLIEGVQWLELSQKNSKIVGMKCKQCSNEAHGDVGSNRKLVGSDLFRCCGIARCCFCPCGASSLNYFLFSFYLHGYCTVLFRFVFLEDCIIRGKWLLNKCVPSSSSSCFGPLKKKKILFQAFFLEHLYSVCVPMGMFWG